MATTTDYAVEMRGITKRFDTTVACDAVDLKVRRGTVHALIGENGAGKSTLMNVLYGLHAPDDGEIFVAGQRTQFASPRDAINLGIGMVHQHFKLVPSLTVAENVTLGHEISRFGFIDRQKTFASVLEASRKFGLEINPRDVVRDLPVGLQQRVEIIKALYRGASILVLDEPTAVLTPQEVDGLFVALRQLVDDGMTIILITHHLNEVMAIAEDVTVMRDGKVVGELRVAETNKAEMASLMVGREVTGHIRKPPVTVGEELLAVKDLRVLNERHYEAVQGVSLRLRAGEIVGIAGVAGNGQEELVEAILGQRRPLSGTVTLNGKDVTEASTKAIREQGLAYVPSDRIKQGLSVEHSIAENMFMTHHFGRAFRRGTRIEWGRFHEFARGLVKEFHVRTGSERQAAGSLSGGNMQKVILAREFSLDANVLIINQPTRGIDIGSAEYVHEKIVQKRSQGFGILLVSMQLDEILRLSDRILVMYAGRIVGEVLPEATSNEELGLLMAGVVERKTA